MAAQLVGKCVVALLTLLPGMACDRAREPGASAASIDVAEALDYPAGVYAMSKYAEPFSDRVLAAPGIVGVLIGEVWSRVEKEPGRYDWSALDAQVERASRSGKKVALKLLGALQQAPEWLKNDPQVTTVSLVETNRFHKTTHCRPLKLPVPWDRRFHERRKALYRAAGERYSGNPAVVAVMASFANYFTDDWHLPHRKGWLAECNRRENQVAEWRRAGYTTEKMFTVGRELIDTVAAAFPRQAVKLPIAPNGELDRSPTELAERILRYAYGNYPQRFFAQSNQLSAVEPPGEKRIVYELLRRYAPRSGLQMLAAASNGATDGCRQNGFRSPCEPAAVLAASFALARPLRPVFVEIWYADANNAALDDVVEEATRAIRDAARWHIIEASP